MYKRPLPAPRASNKQIQSYVDAALRGQKSHHVLPRGEGGWVVKRLGASDTPRTFATQSEAIRYGKSIARDDKADLFIHGKNGRIRERASYAS